MTSREDDFRRASAALVAALTRTFGPVRLEFVEDAVQETLLRAVEAWSWTGIPSEHLPLLVTAARHRVLDALRRERTSRRLAPEAAAPIERAAPASPHDAWLPDALRDDELRMIFTVCHAEVADEVQVALALKLLCGFSVEEIAAAFFVTPAAVEKRLARGKRALARLPALFDLAAADFAPRLASVQRALYLLFSEGYHGAGAEAVVRPDLCREAMRLVRLLVDHGPTATPATYGLAALMWLHAARLPGRLDAAGDLRTLFEQDRSTWDGALVAEGLRLLERAASGDALTPYQVEAGIAAFHASAGAAGDTPWGEIVCAYDALLVLAPSPVVALNRAVAVALRDGPELGLAALEAIPGAERLASQPFLAAARGELELRLGRPEAARAHLETALARARNDAERRFLRRRVEACRTFKPPFQVR